MFTEFHLSRVLSSAFPKASGNHVLRTVPGKAREGKFWHHWDPACAATSQTTWCHILVHVYFLAPEVFPFPLLAPFSIHLFWVLPYWDAFSWSPATEHRTCRQPGWIVKPQLKYHKNSFPLVCQGLRNRQNPGGEPGSCYAGLHRRQRASPILQDSLLLTATPSSRLPTVQLHLPHSTDLPYVESQRDGIIKIGVGTSCINPQMPQNREQEGAENEHTWQDEDVPEDCKRKPVVKMMYYWAVTVTQPVMVFRVCAGHERHLPRHASLQNLPEAALVTS